jgi:putative ABC transport system substrate-binding protein
MARQANRRGFIRSLALLAALPLVSRAQAPKKTYRIGYLRRTSRQPVHLEAFRRGLQDFGHGGNVVIEERYADGATERLPSLAAELVGLKVDVIVVDGTATASAVKKATASIPVVFVVVSDPVAHGFVKSMARPGTNLTGLTVTAGYELAGKRIELFKAAIPELSRVALLGNPTNPSTAPFLREAERAGRALGLQLQSFEATRTSDLEQAFNAVARWGGNGLSTLNDAMFYSERERIVKLALKHRLPAIYPESEFVEAGGLMSYGPDHDDLFRRAAFYVDKILKGTKAADLPVEQPSKFDFVVNSRAAATLGVTIAPAVLLRADRVIRAKE